MTVRALLHQLSVLEAPFCRAASLRAECLETQRLFALVSRLGDGVFWYLIMLLLPAMYGRDGLYAAIQMLGVGVAALVLYKILKGLTGRRRPCEAFPDIRRHAPMLDRYSFPSGHTMHAVGFSVVLLGEFPELGVLVAPFAALVASSRLVLGLHYPSDVIAGAVIGGAVGWASFVLPG